jgi:hypothetical protein
VHTVAVPCFVYCHPSINLEPLLLLSEVCKDTLHDYYSWEGIKAVIL